MDQRLCRSRGDRRSGGDRRWERVFTCGACAEVAVHGAGAGAAVGRLCAASLSGHFWVTPWPLWRSPPNEQRRVLLGLRAAEASTGCVCVLIRRQFKSVREARSEFGARRGLPACVFVHLCVCGCRDYLPPWTHLCARGGWSQRAERRGFQPSPRTLGEGPWNHCGLELRNRKYTRAVSIMVGTRRLPRPRHSLSTGILRLLDAGRQAGPWVPQAGEALRRGPCVALEALAVAARGGGQQRRPGEARGA